MKKDGMYLCGTISEIAAELVNTMTENDKITRKGLRNFKDCDFASAEGAESYEALDELADVSTAWHGIKCIRTGFDSCGLELFANYYGGGSGSYKEIYENTDVDEAINIIKGLIIGTLEYDETCTQDTIIIAEFCR